MDEQRLQLLLDRHFDQMLAVDERKELELMLLAHPRARELFWESARTNALIRNWGEAEWGRQDALHGKFQALAVTSRSRPATVRWNLEIFRRFLLHWFLPACATALIIFGGLASYHALYTNQEFPAHKGIAVLTHISEAAWDNNRKPVQLGEALQPGWLRLDHGAVEIQFARGARVVLEGPAELQLVSENEAFLRRGKLSAHVPPPARGFKLGAANFTVIDHGTEFGCFVNGTNASEVHVFVGKVSWQSDESGVKGRELKKSQAIRFSHQNVQSIPADRTEFLSETELARLDALRESERLADWRTSSDWLRENPATLVYFDFARNKSDPNVLPNQALAAPANSDASIIGCESVEGRWPDKQALEFKRPDDRVRLNVPGQFAALTFVAWIRVDGLPYRQQALAMSQSFDQGEIHWYLYRDGSMSMAEHVKTNSASRGWRDYRSKPLFNEENFGTWAMVVSVCDSKTGEIRHYYNGQQVGIGLAGQPYRVPLRLDTFEIGNWGVHYNDPRWSFIQWGSPDDAVRGFHGRMDEFAVLSTVLSPQDVQRLYREGRPGETIFADAGQ